MAEIIDFKSKKSWNSLEDLDDAPPATKQVSRATETKIINFDVNGRLKRINSKLGAVAMKASKSERLAA